MKRKIIVAIAILLSTISHSQNLKLEVHPDKVLGNITPLLYGAGMEDVNHEIYGGIYSQRIFGESFEEGVLPKALDKFSVYDGIVRMEGDALQIYSEPVVKVISSENVFSEGWAEVDLRFDGFGGFNAGLLMNVTEVRNGKDAYCGYEVVLTRKGVELNRCQYGCSPLAKSEINELHGFDWYKVRAEISDSLIAVYLNDKRVITYEHENVVMAPGHIGVRTVNSNASFRNLRAGYDGKTVELPFTPTGGYAVSGMWNEYFSADARPAYALDTMSSVTGIQSQVIENKATEGCVGVTNQGLNKWGIAVRKGQKFDGGIMLKGSAGKVWVALQGNDGREYGRVELTGISDDWSRHEFVLRSSETDSNARFAIYIEGKGKIWVDQAMLMLSGKDTYKGLPVRGDIARCIEEQGLTMLRYGGTMVNAREYKFASMRGERSMRQPYFGHWYRFSTNGFGIIEFVEFASALGCEISFAVNIDDDPQVMAEMIEYFNGDVSTKWGAQRAKDGHPEPYGIKYIEIGNEEVLVNLDYDAGYDYYIERFNILYEAMRKVDSSLEFVHSAWWRPECKDKMREVFMALDGKAAYWDYHPWVDDIASASKVEGELRRMEQWFKEWNPHTTMRCVLLEENGASHGVRRMLSHAIVQNAVRRMGDFVLATCPANALEAYLHNDNGWNQGQVFFTPDKVWGMPPYHGQKLSSEHHQPFLVESVMTGRDSDLVDVTATRSADGKRIVLHIINKSDLPQNISIDFTASRKIRKAEKWAIYGDENEVNSPDEPQRVSARKQEVDFIDGSCNLKPFSYTVVAVSL